jgi:hypothetical protein
MAASASSGLGSQWTWGNAMADENDDEQDDGDEGDEGDATAINVLVMRALPPPS